MDLRQLLNVIARRWRMLAAVVLLCLLGAGGISSIIPPKYSSTATIYIAATGSGSANDSATLAFYAAQRITSYAALAEQPSMLTTIIEDSGVDISTSELADNMTATVATATTVLQITVEAGNPTAAQDLARAASVAMQDLVSELESTGTDSGGDPISPIVARIPSDPSYNETPVSPNVPLNLVVGGLIGLIFGIIAVILRDMFDSSVKTAQEIGEITHSPVLAVIPEQSSFSRHPLITDRDAPAGRGEPFRVLRTNLQFVDLDAKRQMFVITSAVPDEGKSVTAVNLAIAIAQSGREVLVIDCDLRKPSVAKLLDLDNAVGFMTAVTATAPLYECVQKHSSGIHVLATGPKPPNPAEVLDTDTVRALLRQAQVEYDVVIIDAPPLLAVADPAILSGMVGGAIMVVRHGRTKREQLRQAVARLDAVDARIFGVVPNGARKRDIDAYSYEYYEEDPPPTSRRRETNGRVAPGVRSSREARGAIGKYSK